MRIENDLREIPQIEGQEGDPLQEEHEIPVGPIVQPREGDIAKLQGRIQLIRNEMKMGEEHGAGNWLKTWVSVACLAATIASCVLGWPVTFIVIIAVSSQIVQILTSVTMKGGVWMSNDLVPKTSRELFFAWIGFLLFPSLYALKHVLTRKSQLEVVLKEAQAQLPEGHEEGVGLMVAAQEQQPEDDLEDFAHLFRPLIDPRVCDEGYAPQMSL